MDAPRLTRGGARSWRGWIVGLPGTVTTRDAKGHFSSSEC